MKLFELQDRPEQEKNFERNIMPQIRKGNLENSPFKFKKGKIHLDKLKPVQSQRVKGMHDKAKQGFADGSIRPIVIDKNNYIVNGHHRYDVARGLELKKVRVLKVDASIEDLIDHFTDTASPEPTYEQIMKAKLDSLMETIEASQDISALMKGIEADLKQREKDLKRLPKKSVYEAPIIRPQDSYDPDANDAYNTATNRQPPKYDYDPEMDYRPGKSLGKIPNIQSETEVVQMPNGDLYLFYANSMSVSSRETPRQKTMWQKAISHIMHNPKANQTGPNKEKNVLGFLKLKPFEDGYRVAGVGMDPEIRGQGKAIKFYLAFSAWKGVPIYSDFSQTPSAKTMWSSITARYPKRVVAYDQKSKKDIPLAKAGDMYQDQPDGFDKMNQHKAAKVLGGTKLFKLLPEGEVIHKNFGRDQSIEKQINPGEPQKAYDAYDGDYLPYYFSNGWKLTLMDEEYSMGEHEVWVLNDANGKEIERGEKQSDLVSTLQDMTQIPIQENFKDGKVKGKSRPGRVKKSGASCNGSVTSLRKKAKNSSGEKAKMYHWCANMKAGRKKSK
tara:strand:- start:2904 stop:4571 length:1668 start_codon:yes stop_codon:yes gene_type:complete